MVRTPLQRPEGRSDGVRTTRQREQGRSGGVRTTPKRGSCRFLGSGPPRGHGACQNPCGAQAQHEHTEIPGLPHPPAQETSALRGCGSVERTGGRRKQKFTTEAQRHGAEGEGEGEGEGGGLARKDDGTGERGQGEDHLGIRGEVARDTTTAPNQQQTLSSGSVSPCLRGALLRLRVDFWGPDHPVGTALAEEWTRPD